MKIFYLVLFIFLGLFVSGCIKNDNQANDRNHQLSSKKYINLDQNSEINFTIPENLTDQEKKEFEVKVEKAKKIIKHLTGENKIIYDFKTNTFKKLLNDNSIPNSCKSKNIDYFFRCLIKNNIKVDYILNNIPEEQRNYVKKRYYIQKYSTKPKTLFQPSNDPIELEIKKKFITNYIANGIITRKETCNKIPEKEIRDYCKSIFNP